MFKLPPAQPDFAALEEEVLSFWQQEKIFQKSVTQNEGKPTFVIYDGPPYANAKPPLHTMVPMSFKDLAGRYKTMRGYYVPRQPGWDTHGLPIEVQVEKTLGLTSKKDILNLVPGNEAASIQKFNEICKTSVFEFKKEWDKFVPRVGYWTDIDHPYITYEPEYISRAWGVFKQVWERELAYKGYKVLPYCPRCGTGLSAAEVAQEYRDIKDVSVFVSFPLTDDPSTSFLAWTTTPWTLPGNVGLAVGPNIEYVTVLQEEKKYILAKARLEILSGEYEIIGECKGSELVGITYLPLYPSVLKDAEGKKFEVVAADFVTTTDGTGIVHTAVMYGEDDFNLGKEVGFAMQHSVGLDGTFLSNVTEFAGMYVRDALVPILKDLTEKGRLYGKLTITHSYPHCWRCKTPLIYYAKDSWFIAMSKLRKELVANNSTVNWIPEHVREGRFGDFVREARDWAVSRERFWGIPLPIWTSKSGKYLCVGSIEELRSLAQNPAQVGSDFDPHRPLVDDIILLKEGEEYFREPFVLDIWFDSGAMPYASGKEEAGLFPADYIAEAVDQTRGWFYVLMALGTAIKDQSPFRNVICMGHLVDENGKKMSKSLGNVFDPWETFKITGADAIRWYFYTVNSPGEAKAFSIKEVQNSFRKTHLLYWNVFNYFVTYANVAEFEAPSEEGRKEARAKATLLDRWILSRQAALIEEVTAELDAYDFMRAGRALEAFVTDLSTWYLRRSRKREDATFYTVLYDILLTVSTLLAPFTPFITETVYQILRRDTDPQSVHLCSWPAGAQDRDLELEETMAKARQVVELGLSIRAQEKIKVRQPLKAAYTLYFAGFTEEIAEILAEELNVLSVFKVSELPEEAVLSRKEGYLQVALDTKLDDALIQAGLAREFLRQIQNIRKKVGLMPGQLAHLEAAPMSRALLEGLLASSPTILEEAFLVVDEASWTANPENEIELNGETLAVTVRPR